MSSKPVNAAIYLRISQDPNEDGLAVERQRDECESIAKSRGWNVVRTYADTVSASKRNVVRPNYDQMYKDFRAGAFQALICWDLDRLTRQPRQLEDWIEAAEVGLLLVTADGQADLSTVNGRMFARMKATIARTEIELKGNRQRAKNVQLVKAGRPVPGRRRFGYKSDNMTPEPRDAEVVRNIFKEFDEGASIYKIAQGLGWRNGRVRETLSNRAYAGAVKHLDTFYPSTEITPLVEVELFERAQVKLKDPTRRTSPGSEIKHLLSGIARCGVCGEKCFYRNAYMCSKTTNHAQVNKRTADEAVMWKTLEWVFRNQDKSLEKSNSERLVELIQEGREIDAQLNRAIDMQIAEDLGDNAHMKARISELKSAANKNAQAVFTERSASSNIDAQMRVRELWNAQVPLGDFENWRAEIHAALSAGGESEIAVDVWQYEFIMRNEKVSKEWPLFWAELELLKKRELVSSLFEVVVNKGAPGPNKVEIRYK